MRGDEKVDVVVVGGGLGGLTTATLLAREGLSVRLLERAQTLGGRAVSHSLQGHVFNLGPHALYGGGPAERILTGLGIHPSGAKARGEGAYLVEGATLHAMPGGALTLLTTGALSASGKVELARLLVRIPRVDPEPLGGTTLRDWLTAHVRGPDVRRALEALFRVSSYAHHPDTLSAATALGQVQRALRPGVRYLDGGWQTLVDALARAAQRSGVQVRTGARVEAVEHDGRVRAVRLADGGRVEARAVVLAGSPAIASALVDGGAHPHLSAWAAAAVPVHAACLDVALSALPRPRARFALGLDRPLYFSVHSAYARLAPEGHAVVQLARYLSGDEAPAAVEAELEGLLELLQPGWRAHLVERRFLPHLTVMHALPLAARGGPRRRPGPAVPGVEGLCVVGDWVGPEGLLADAVLSSAERAALHLAPRLGARPHGAPSHGSAPRPAHAAGAHA